MGFLFTRGKNTTSRADLIADFQINTASYGEVVPEILGTTRVSGNIIDYEDFTAHEHKSTTRTGKGGGSKHTNITYTYTVAAAIALCEGPIAGIGKVWRDKEIFKYPNENIQLTLFNGEVAQAPWPYMTSKHPEKALPYSGLAYMAGVVDLGERGSLPQYNFEVYGKLRDTGDGVDVNPADYIEHVLQSVGADVQIEGIENFRAYCKAADILISTPPEQKSAKAQQIINDIAEITNSLVFWSTDRLKIVPLADKPIGTWTPANQIQYDLTADDFIAGTDGQLILYKRKDTSEAFNEATVEFINRANGYEKETVSFEVVADVQRNGLKPASKKTAHYLYTKARAQYYAEQLAMKRLYAKTQYTFRLDWAFCTLEVGDLVTLTDEACQLNKQIVVITAVNEAADGQLEFTAEGKPAGTYAPARYDVHENERPFIDYNQAAPSVNDVAIFQTVGDVGGNQVFIGVNAPAGWGGCSVWLSDTDQNYSRIGSISQQARMGRTRLAFNETATACEVTLNQGTLKGGTHIDAERANTLCWVNGEALSYEGATMGPNNQFSLSGLVRGQYGTNAISHNAGERFIRIDEALFRYPYRKEDIGKTIYLKFTSMNIFGTNEQGLDEVQAYPYTLTPYFIPEVTDLTLYTKYYEITNRVKSFDVVAEFNVPQINSLDTVEIWYREPSGQWKYGGAGEGQVIISGCELGHTYEIKAVVKDTHGNTSQGVSKSITVELKSEIPNKPLGFSISFSDMAHFNWLEVRNADVDYYELRLDLNAGQNDGLIGRSNNTTYSGTLQNRTGKVYLYAHNPAKGYGAPAELTYNVPQPKQPTNLKTTANINGIGVTFEPIPANCKGANVYVDSKVYFTTTNALSIPLEAGIYNVKVAYVDIFGEGPTTEAVSVAVKAKIDKELLDMESLGISNMDKAINDLKDEVGTVKTSVNGFENKLVDQANAFQRSITDLNKHVDSQITQISDGIELKVTNALGALDGKELISRINLTPAGTRIDGRLLHVTGQALFDNNIITKGMLQAGSVTADKMQVDSLSTITANIGDLKGGTITGTVIKNASNTFSVDENGNIRGANITGSRIDANSVYANGVPLKNTNFMSLHVVSGQKINLPAGYSYDRCLYYLTNVRLFTDFAYKITGRYFNDDDMNRVHDFNNRYSMYWNGKPGGGRIDDLEGGYWLHGEPLQNRVFFPNGDAPAGGTFSFGRGYAKNNAASQSNDGRWYRGCGITKEGYFYFFYNSGRFGYYGEADLLIISFW
ncbi:phage tail protein [Veillonella parvula]|uniref:phage tail protein n=1 Tax=Veillonella parvula TaxID=29466 RepID=UPI00265E839E|nr:phage tail protein [Veillonella parvula]